MLFELVLCITLPGPTPGTIDGPFHELSLEDSTGLFSPDANLAQELCMPRFLIGCLPALHITPDERHFTPKCVSGNDTQAQQKGRCGNGVLCLCFGGMRHVQIDLQYIVQYISWWQDMAGHAVMAQPGMDLVSTSANA